MRRFALPIVAVSVCLAGSLASAEQAGSGDPAYSYYNDVAPVSAAKVDSTTASAQKIGNSVADKSFNYLDNGSCQATCGDCGCADECCCGCGWYGLAEAIFFSRVNRNSNQPVVILDQDENGNYPGPVVLTTGDLATANANTGLRLILGYRLGDCWAVEGTYYGIWNMNSSATAVGDNNLAIPGDLGLASIDFFNADRMVVTYNTRLNNAEINFVRENCCNDWAWLIGFRFLELDDVFNIASQRDIDTGISNYNIHANNDLYGPQIGARIVKRYCRWGWDATGKIGIFGNAASQTQFESDFPPGFFLRDPVTARGGQVACVADFNISGTYRLNETWGIRAGYNVLWIEGIATAPDQLDFTDTPTSGSNLVSVGGLFIHGASVGLEANW
jgi:hypothetical protein